MVRADESIDSFGLSLLAQAEAAVSGRMSFLNLVSLRGFESNMLMNCDLPQHCAGRKLRSVT